MARAPPVLGEPLDLSIYRFYISIYISIIYILSILPSMALDPPVLNEPLDLSISSPVLKTTKIQTIALYILIYLCIYL